MPAVAPPRYMSPATVARLLGVRDGKIFAWIRSGELSASNLATARDGRPRWKISREAVDEFLAARQAIPVMRAARRAARRRMEDQHVTEYF